MPNRLESGDTYVEKITEIPFYRGIFNNATFSYDQYV